MAKPEETYECLKAGLSLLGMKSQADDLKLADDLLAMVCAEPGVSARRLASRRMALAGFTPKAVWRCDPPIWQCTRSFLVDAGGTVVVLHWKERCTIRIFRSNGQAIEELFNEAKQSTIAEMTPTVAEDVTLVQRILRFTAKAQWLEIGRRKAYRLWNGRIYDSLVIMSKIRHLWEHNLIEVDELIVHERYPLLRPEAAVGKLADRVREIADEAGFEAELAPDRAYARELHLPSGDPWAFWPSFKAIPLALAQEARDAHFVVSPAGKPFCLWISFDLEKRVCINQAEEFRALILALAGRYGPVRVLVNGLTGGEGDPWRWFEPDIKQREEELIESVVASVPEIEVVELYGLTFREKMQAAAGADLFVAPKGNACVAPMCLDVPGVFFGPRESYITPTLFDHLSNAACMMPVEDVISITEDLAMRKVTFGLDDGTRISYRLQSGRLTELALHQLEAAERADLARRRKLKSARIVALMLGRGGSSLARKNVLPVHGVPLLLWTASAAVRSQYVGRYYVSSEDQEIIETAGRAGYHPILRPLALASATAQSSDAVRHALPLIEADGPVDILVVQHANVGTLTAEIIDACIEQLLADPTLTSVVPAHEKPEYHPLRARTVAADGTLSPFINTDAPISANRQDLPTCLFFDHSIWVLRADAINSPDGQQPWPCMGSRIAPYLTDGCLDVHSLDDLILTERWITAHGVPSPRPARTFVPLA